jgi:lysophospholipase L1-like esterase
MPQRPDGWIKRTLFYKCVPDIAIPGDGADALDSAPEMINRPEKSMRFAPGRARSLAQRLLVTLVVGCGLAPAMSRADADGPTPYPNVKDESAWPGKGPIRCFDWMTADRKKFWAKREQDQGKIVFACDSLTAGWKPEYLAKAFPDLKIANRGIGGDVSRGLLFRFKEDVLDLKPTALVLTIGGNDLSAHADPANIESNIVAMLTMARAYSETMPIVVCQLPPRDAKDAPMKPGAFKDHNARVAKLADKYEHLVVVDLFTPLALPDGMPIPECFSKDRIHLAGPGYDKWAEQLRPAFEKLGVK